MINNNSKLMNIVLDLDETLIHSVQLSVLTNFYDDKYIEELKKSPYFLISEEYIYKDDNGIDLIEPHTLFVFYRPYLFDFLKFLNTKFNIYIATHGVKKYAISIIKKIMEIIPELRIENILCRQHILGECNPKSLSYFPLDHNNTIIIDDRIDVWKEDCVKNIIQIKKYLGILDGFNDNELINVIHKINCIYENYIVNLKLEDVNVIDSYDEPPTDIFYPIDKSNKNHVSFNDLIISKYIIVAVTLMGIIFYLFKKN